jgi:hypothetical protein
MAGSPPPPPPSPPSVSPVKLTLTPGSPMKLSPTKQHHHRVAGVGENTTTSKDNSTVASSSSSFSHEDNNVNASALISPPLLFEIEAGTPAAEALRANADVRVSKLRKVGRSVRVLKPASRTSRGGSGVHVRSKSLASIDQTPPAILEVDDEGGSDNGVGGDMERQDNSDDIMVSTSQDNAIDKSTQIIYDSGNDREKQFSTPPFNTEGVNQSKTTLGTPINVESASRTQTPVQTQSRQKTPPTIISAAKHLGEDHKDDVSTHKDDELHTTLSTHIESLLLAQHPTQRLSGSFTHLASSAAVAAACLAGEEMDRKRAAQIQELSLNEGVEDVADATGQAHKSPLKQPFTILFRANANLSEVVSIDDSVLPIRRSPRPSILRKRACSVSEGIGQPPLLPRGASIGSSSPAIALLKSSTEPTHELPSEISIGETQIHANIGKDGDADATQAIDDVSDDGNALLAEKRNDDTEQSPSEKQISFNPILVEIPGSTTRQFTVEESKEEEELHSASVNERDADHHKPLMTKARRKLSRMSIKKKEVIPDDDDSFYFHGPKSVRKWVKRRRSMEENKDPRSYVKGKVIDGKHELYTMSIAVMFGMRTSIGRTNLAMSQTAHNSRRWLDTDHLMAVEKYEFPPRVSVTVQHHSLYQRLHSPRLLSLHNCKL